MTAIIGMIAKAAIANPVISDSTETEE